MRSLVGSLVLLAVAAPPVALGAAPRTDWEGARNDGAALSFERQDSSLSNVVLSARNHCSQNGQREPANLSAFSLARRIPTGSHGRVTYRRSVPGGVLTLVGRIAGGTGSVVYRSHSRVDLPNPFTGQTVRIVCDTGRVLFHVARATRVGVRDGAWRGSASDAEGVVFRVTAGGRLIDVRPTGPSWPGGSVAMGTTKVACSGPNCLSRGDSTCAASVEEALFVRPDGSFTSVGSGGPGGVDVTGRFGVDATAAGSWTDSTAGSACSLDWTARAG